MVAAIFFPADPDASLFDTARAARAELSHSRYAGLRLYTNGRQLAGLPKPAKGWAKLGYLNKPANPVQPTAAAA